MFTAFCWGDVMITMGTGKMSRQVEKELGLAAQHDYAVLDLKEEGGQQWVLLKNPWCEATLWKDAPALVGLSSLDISSTSASPDAKLAPGTFWISLSNISQHFESVYLNWNPGLFSSRQEIHFTWDRSVPANCSSTSLINHPQFVLSSKAGGSVWLLLCRHFQDLPEKKDGNSQGSTDLQALGHISLSVFRRGGQLVHIDKGAAAHGEYVDSPQVLLKYDMDTNSKVTVVVSEHDLPQTPQNFTLIAFAVKDAALDHATKQYGHATSVKGNWFESSAGGGLHSPRFPSNPQFKLEIPSPTKLAVLLESTKNPDLNVNVKVCYGDGKRVHALKKQDILLDSGEYRKGSDFCERTDAPLGPGKYTLVVSTFEPGELGEFSLRVASEVEVKFTELPAEHAGKFIERLPKAIFGADMTKLAFPLSPQRLVSILGIATFASSFCPPDYNNTSGSGHLLDGLVSDNGRDRLRSPLRIYVQVGSGPNSQIFKSSNRGEFSVDTEAGIRLPETSLDPQLVRDYGVELWLVLERMGRGPAGSEERYWVDILSEGGVGGSGLAHGIWHVWRV